MSQEDRLFSNEGAVVVDRNEQPELYRLAEDALFNGDSTFTYEGRLWEVHEGVLTDHFIIRPEVPNS